MNGVVEDYVVLSNVTKAFGQNKILDGLCLSIKKNNIISIVGKSGCGKTTLLNIMSGILSPDFGKIYLNSQDITGVPGFMSYMMQKDLLLEYKTVIDNVAMPLILKGTKKKIAREQVKQYFPLFKLKDVENLYPNQLSGGMRQRVAFMRTYVATDKVALLDEPFSKLDELTKKDIYSWFLEVTQKIDLTIVIVTHNIEEALRLSDRVYVLNDREKKLLEMEKNVKQEYITSMMI